jgi:hypothetical protein
MPLQLNTGCIGGTTMRLRSLTPPMVSGENSNIRDIYHFLVRHRTSKSRHRASALLEYGDDIGAPSLRQSRTAFMSNL